MKKILSYTIAAVLLASGLLVSSCEDYLNVMPKGKKVPSTLADFEAFIRNESSHLNDVTQSVYLLNDLYLNPNNQAVLSLSSINYNWQAEENRIIKNESLESAYGYGYQAIFYWNLIITSVPDIANTSDAAKQQLIAQAKVLRAMNYYQLTNYYADQYYASAAAETLSVPLITSPDMGAPSEQVSIARMYEFILQDLTDALPHLPTEGATVLHPNLGCGHAMLARVYLTMGDYEKALANAERALAQNSRLFDWREYYETNKAQIERPDDWATSYPSVMLNSPENYIFRYGTTSQRNYGQSGLNGALTLQRASLFEEGDARFASKWKKRYEAPDSIYYGIRNDKFNGGGITTPEMYYIKAECLARKGTQADIDNAMAALNTVREKRIFADRYTPRTATTTKQAIGYIIQEKANEYVQTGIPFWDRRRLNKDAEYAVTYSKVVNGVTVSLPSQSHLWIMVFPMAAIGNPGNGTLTQNTPR